MKLAESKILRYYRKKERAETGREKGKEEEHSIIIGAIVNYIRNLKLFPSREQESILKCSITMG